MADWIECGTPGECSIHGMSEKARQKILREHGSGPWSDYDRSHQPCPIDYHLCAYLARGRVKVGGQRVELRARIEQCDHAAWGELFAIRIWAQQLDGTIVSGEFSLFEDGRSFSAGKPEPTLADLPRRLAFWRESESASQPA